ncbi:glycosyltransferase [Chryseobacterium daecheongense]|uniref:glycosyltransferase family 2 protein n=1 Tax=Chryseobacterium daecheongense TaxID=192389 RepID=UPI001FD66331|nr:glycosyltransferase [Chryseobacterium daecheongense]UOU99050.1 glycosyltransferase [Chryseobacterium daecheongense]
MKFTILIANYNNGRFFKNCYDSIIAQEYKNWEVIITDDASTDNSVEIINDLIKGDPRFRLLINPENKGCGYTKRKCMEYASGTYCAFLDPDDALYPNALKDSVEHLQNSRNIAVYSKLTFCDEDLNAIGDFKKIKQIYNEKYFFNSPIQLHHFFSFKRDAYLKTEGIDPTLASAVDQDLYLKLLEHGNAKYIPVRMYKYRQHAQGISQSSSKEKAKMSFAKVIFNSFKRRNISKIGGKSIPKDYKNTEDIFSLLDYQTKIGYRLKAKILGFFQKDSLF